MPEAHRKLLVSFERGNRIGISSECLAPSNLPAVKWRQQNLDKL